MKDNDECDEKEKEKIDEINEMVWWRMNSPVSLPYNRGHENSEAMIESKQKFNKPMFSSDIIINDGIISKNYVLGGYVSFCNYYFKLQSGKRCYYEILLENIPSNLYIDLEINKKLNEEKFKKFETEIEIQLFEYIIELLIELNYIEERNECSIIILDSSNEIKISRHYIILLNEGYKKFRNTYHCGEFVRKLQSKIILIEKLNSNEELINSKFFIANENKNNIQTINFICDLSVYTKNRPFRLFYSTKIKQNRFLLPKLNQKYFHIKDIEKVKVKELFYLSLIQYINYNDLSRKIEILNCLYLNINEPISTSKTRISINDKPSININGGLSLFNKYYYEFYTKKFEIEKIWEMFGDENREFGFTLTNHGLIRKRFFKSIEEFRDKISELNILSIHIGAIYNNNRRYNENWFKFPTEKELTFDIDLNNLFDINDKKISFRYGCCGSEKTCCLKCWEYAKKIIVILYKILFDIFLFKDIKFFYSGSKGFHCWVFDKNIRKLNNPKRKSILNYFNSDHGEIIKQNELLFTDLYEKLILPNCNKILFEDNKLNDYLFIKLKEEKWTIEQTLFYCFWPRLDGDVTKGSNHLIKCPFTLHASTKNFVEELTVENNFTPSIFYSK